jgi:hypothetical protein
MSLWSTQLPVKMSTRNIYWGKDGRGVRLTSPKSRAECHEIWEPKAPGNFSATPGLLRDRFTFIWIMKAAILLWRLGEKGWAFNDAAVSAHFMVSAESQSFCCHGPVTQHWRRWHRVIDCDDHCRILWDTVLSVGMCRLWGGGIYRFLLKFWCRRFWIQ